MRAACELLAAGPEQRRVLLEGGREEVQHHALLRERREFLEILGRVPELWLA